MGSVSPTERQLASSRVCVILLSNTLNDPVVIPEESKARTDGLVDLTGEHHPPK